MATQSNWIKAMKSNTFLILMRDVVMSAHLQSFLVLLRVAIFQQYLESFFQFVLGDVATAVLVKELESLEHVFFLFKLAQIHRSSQEFSVVNAAYKARLTSIDICKPDYSLGGAQLALTVHKHLVPPLN